MTSPGAAFKASAGVEFMCYNYKSWFFRSLETNNISPTGVVRVLDAINKMHSVEDVRLANQASGAARFANRQVDVSG